MFGRGLCAASDHRVDTAADANGGQEGGEQAGETRRQLQTHAQPCPLTRTHHTNPLLLLFDGITLSVEVIVSVTTVTCRHSCLSMPVGTHLTSVGTLTCRCHRFRIAADKLLRGFCCAQEADGDGASRRCVSAGGCAVGMRQAKAAGATNRARRAQTAIEQRREPTNDPS